MLKADPEQVPPPALDSDRSRVRLASRSLLEQSVRALKELCSDVETANAFYEPYFLLPAIHEFSDYRDIRTAIIRGVNGRLIGLLPFERSYRFRSIPVLHLRALDHRHCYLTEPLFRSGYEAEALNSFLTYLDKHSSIPFFAFPRLEENGPVAEALRELAKQDGRSLFCTDEISRAVCSTVKPFDQYLQDLPRKYRKDLQRKQRRASELGELRYEQLSQVGELGGWCEEFLELEAAGWKGGEQGKALKQELSDERYFKESVSRAWVAGQLVFSRLRLDDKTLAMSCTFLSGGTAFIFKTCFDEAHSKLSPGLLLKLYLVDALAARGDVKLIDSCSEPGSELFKRLFFEERKLCTIFISAKRPLGKSLLRLFSGLRRLKQIRRSA